MTPNSGPIVTGQTFQGSAETVSHFVDRCLGPVDAAPELFAKDVIEARVASLEREARLQQSPFSVTQVRDTVRAEVEALGSDKVREEALRIRAEDRTRIVSAIQRELSRKDGAWKLVSALRSMYGVDSGEFGADRTTQRGTFQHSEPCQPPTFIRRQS